MRQALLEGWCDLPSLPRLLPIPTERVPEFWPLVAPLIESVRVRMQDSYTLDMLREDAESGEKQLWVVDDGHKIKAAVLTMILTDRAGKTGWLTHCGGSEQRLWSREVIDSIGDFFTCEGCNRFFIVGRKGWLKFLPDFNAQSILYEKAL